MSHLENQRSAAAAATSAVSGKTARACHGCTRRCARWYCAADDAFLCQSCDSSVHSANPLARRHSRLRLKTVSSWSDVPAMESEELVPSWIREFKRRARTPRLHLHAKTAASSRERRAQPTTVVPELIETSVEETEDEEQQQLIYCVPVFDPAIVEFHSPSPIDDSNASSGDEAKPTMEQSDCNPASTSSIDIDTANRMAAFLPTDMDLADFATNMESLLDESDGSFSMEKLGLVDSTNQQVNYFLDDNDVGRLKTEQPDNAEQCPVEVEIDMSREMLEQDFRWPGSSTAEEEEFEEEKVEVATEQQEEVAKKARLRLDYEAVISAWSSHGSSPWTDGERPHINLDGCLADYMGMWVERGGEGLGAGQGGDGGGGNLDVGRQARVSRYREKRRTRPLAKKIRYEVRKLNAEKRPRMKGRFVKRSPGPAALAH